jgi:cytidylate kinase
MNKRITIAIDGFSACGKSTLAKAVATQLGYSFIDSGAMYRGAALFFYRNSFVSEEHLDLEGIHSVIDKLNLSFRLIDDKNCLFLNDENIDEEIRQAHVAAIVSKVATIKAVRVQLVKQQQEMGRLGGIVMDGRDIGSVVFPNAELKLFITANVDIRVQRRFDELKEKGIPQTMTQVKENLIQRDHVDSTRAESPLVKVDDALVLDNSFLSKDQQLDKVLNLVSERIKP